MPTIANQPEIAVSGWEIAAMRKKLGLTQRDLAKVIGTHQPIICWLETEAKLRLTTQMLTTLRTMIDTADHLKARRANPNWDI